MMNQKEIVSMCEKLASKYKTPHHYEDLVSEGVVACYEVLAKEDDPHPAELWRMANRRMHDYLNFTTAPMSIPKSDTARKVARGSGEYTSDYSEAGIRHLEQALRGEVVELDEYMSYRPDHADDYENREFEAYVMSVAVTTLDLKELKLLKERYYEGKSQEELAVELGVSKMTISRWEDEMLYKIRQAI